MNLKIFFPSALSVKSRLGFLLGLFLFFTSQSMIGSLQAQACSDALCNSVPKLLQDNYLKNLNQSFAEAHAVAATSAMPYIGKTRVDHVTVGGQITYGVRTDIDRSFKAEGNSVKNLTQPVGRIAYGSYFAGVNIGGLLNWFGLVTSLLGLPSFASLDNFDILVARSDTAISSIGSVEYAFKTSYAGIRYQMIPGLGLPILGGWKGIVFGVGYLSSTVSFSQLDDSVDNVTVNDLEWREGREKFTLESNLSNVVLELNTGLEILFLNVTAGVGVLLNDGESKLKYEREGKAFKSGGALGDLNVNLKDEVDAPSSIYYYKMGLEFPLLPFVRLGGEASYANKGAYSYALALRLSL